MNTQISGTLVLLALLGLAACGGGGGGTSPPTGGTTPPANQAPVAHAGDDQSVPEGSAVELSAADSTDPEGDALTFSWQQTAGPEVALSNADQPIAAFIAPFMSGGTSLTFELTASDGDKSSTDSVTITVADITPPTGNTAPSSKVLGKSEPVVVTFNEAVDPTSLVLGGTLADEANVTWTNGNKVLTLSSSADEGEWVSGSNKTIEIEVADTAGNTTAEPTRGEWLVKLVFGNFQAADVVIGQPGFVTNGDNPGGRSASTLGQADGAPAFSNGWLYVSDTYINNRVLGYDGIPTANGSTASLLLGQATFADADIGPVDDSHFLQPIGMSAEGGKLALADADRNRVLVYDPAPSSTMPASLVLGQANFGSDAATCTDSGMWYPTEVLMVDGKLLVVDADNNRILIWTSMPTANGQPADLVLGQQDFTHCADNDQDGDGGIDGPAANTLRHPWGIWSDGQRIAAIDSSNQRVLIWNSFPTENGQPADIVLGQLNFTNVAGNDDNQAGIQDAMPTARTLNNPYSGITSNGVQLFVTDNGNHRVLVWDEFPTENFQPADVVLGQGAMNAMAANDTDLDGVEGPGVDAHVFKNPRGLLLVDDKLIINDGFNARVLIFQSE